jgi:hypothetical protein
MASNNYDSFFEDLALNNIDVGVDTFYMLLVTSSYTPSKAHNRRDDITNEVANGNGYATEGKVVVLTPTLDTVNHRYDIAIGSVSWAASSITAAGAVVYKRRAGAASADELVCFLDFGGNVTSSNGTFTVTPSSPIRIQN